MQYEYLGRYCITVYGIIDIKTSVNETILSMMEDDYMCKFNLRYGLVAFVISAIVILGLDCIPAFSDQREAFSIIQQLAEQGKIPAYVIERGIYKYVDGTRSAHVKGRNVFMRSQPLKGARIIAKLNNVDLNYLGEWTHPDNGERWVCVRKYSSNEIGWIYGQYIELLKETSKSNKQISTDSKEGKKYKKNKDCAEDPCGALCGFLLASPIIFLFNKIDDERQAAKKAEKKWLTNMSDINSDDSEKQYCPNYRSGSCSGCQYLDTDDTPYDHQDYSKCKYLGRYVCYSNSPQENIRDIHNGRSDYNYEDECCPEYRKAHCRSCSLIDLGDEYHGYYRCTYFSCYVDADCSPQHNSNNKKYM